MVVERIEVAGATVEAVVGDLTTQEVDAIVNAANKELRHGGGVAGAIAGAGGPEIQAESDDWVDEHGPLADGEAAVTTAGDLPADRVIHTAGPVYEEGGDNESRLRAAVRGALRAADAEGARSVALPAISAGIYGYPVREATGIIASEVVDHLRDDGGRLELVRLVALDEDTADGFAEGLRDALQD